jgi:hypothetical protein
MLPQLLMPITLNVDDNLTYDLNERLDPIATASHTLTLLVNLVNERNDIEEPNVMKENTD